MDRRELPLPDFDHLTEGDLSAKIAPLTAGEVRHLLDYEREHARRLPIRLLLERRIERLEAGAEPAEPSDSEVPDVSAPGGGSKVSPETAGPTINPPSQGVPTNPAQPR